MAAQRPDGSKSQTEIPEPRVGAAVFAALAMAVAVTLILGIAPNEVLRAAEAGAHTLQTPGPRPEVHGIVIERLQTGVERPPNP